MSIVLSARLIVIAVLGYSGLAKLGSPNVVTAAEDLGLSRPIARWVGRFLAPAELLVAGLLCLGATAFVGAVAALALFSVFTALVAWNLWQGKKPACACFGEASAAAISNWTLGRDLLFVALAALVVAGGPAESATGVVGGLAGVAGALGTEATLAVLFLLQGALLIGFWARAGAGGPASSTAPTAPAEAAIASVVGWPPGTLAPGFDLPSLQGPRVTLNELIARGRPVVLFFTAPDCRHCTALLPEIALWQESHARALTIALVSRGSAAENRARVEEFEIRDLVLQGGAEVAEAYQALGTPAAVVIDPSRRLASRLAMGPVEIRNLVEAWAGRSRAEAPVSVLSPPPPADPTRVLLGDAAPPFKLPALRGGDVDLSEVAGRLTAILFWNPWCGHCRGLAPDLKAREKDQTETSVQMMFVAAGTREANEAEGFLSPVLLDQSGAVGRAYGVKGTPSAVLVDAESHVASAVAVGSAEIEALLRRADRMAHAARRVQA